MRRDGRLVQAVEVERARAEGADGKAIHDMVVIVAALFLFNRCMDVLGSWSPEESAGYLEPGVRVAEQGYLNYDPGKG